MKDWNVLLVERKLSISNWLLRPDPEALVVRKEKIYKFVRDFERIRWPRVRALNADELSLRSWGKGNPMKTTG